MCIDSLDASIQLAIINVRKNGNIGRLIHPSLLVYLVFIFFPNTVLIHKRSYLKLLRVKHSDESNIFFG